MMYQPAEPLPPREFAEALAQVRILLDNDEA